MEAENSIMHLTIYTCENVFIALGWCSEIIILGFHEHTFQDRDT